MRRLWILPVFLCGLILSASPTIGEDNKEVKKEEKKDKPKPSKIKTNEPTEAAKDADFAIQGEYLGKVGDSPVGVQVVALGNGNFDLKIIPGGLPGAGGDEKQATKAVAKTESGKVMVTGKDLSGTIADGKLALKSGEAENIFSKTTRTSPTIGAKPPEGAVVLFGDEKSIENWNGGKIVELSDGKYLNNGITTKKTFGAFKLHLEFRLPYQPSDRGQGRGNSGLYLQNRYELQILDSFGLKGENNECGGIYTQYSPSPNMCLPPLVWQTYDVEFTPAVFEGDKKTKPAVATILHNGVKIHDKIELKGPTGGGQPEKGTPGAFQLQNHGDPLVFRNIWVVEVK